MQAGGGWPDIVGINPHAIGGGVIIQQAFHFKDAVDRCAQTAGNLAGDIFHCAQILVVNRIIHAVLLEPAQRGQGDHRTAGRGHGQLPKPPEFAAQGKGHLQIDKARLKRVFVFDIAQTIAAQRHFQLPVYGVNRHTQPRGLFAVDHKAPAVKRHLQIAVGVNDVFGLIEQPFHITGHLPAGGIIGAVNFGDHGLQYGRAGGHFHHFNPRTQLVGQRFQCRSGGYGQFMRGAITVALGCQLHLNIGLPREIAQVGVAHKAVEIERAGGAGIALQGHDFGHLQQFVGQAGDHIGSDGQGGALGHVHHHVEFRLVVVGQHFDRDGLGVEQRKT